MRNPTSIPSVEKRDGRSSTPYFCSMCRSSFDMEAYEIDNACPGCAHMDKAQENHRGAL